MRRGDGNDLWFVSRKEDIIIRSGTRTFDHGSHREDASQQRHAKACE
jgi:hypothetical protein